MDLEKKRGEKEKHTAAWLTRTRNQTHFIPYGNRRDYLLDAVIKFGNPLEPSRSADDLFWGEIDRKETE